MCKRFEEIGLVTLDCDVIARQVVEPGRKGFREITALFGSRVVGEDGSLDRSALREIIVKDDSARLKMEAALHPKILEEMISQMEHADYTGKKNAVAVEVPLLFETGMETYFDLSIAVLSGRQQLVQRISARDGVAGDQASGLLDLQMSQEEKSNRADYRIKNNGSLPELFDMVDNIFAEIEKEFLTT